MKIGSIEIIGEFERSTRASTWNEYLCIERRSQTSFLLSVRGYDVLGEVTEYTNDDGKIDLPDTIDGNDVHGIEDMYVVGGYLSPRFDDDFVFSDPGHDDVDKWLISVDWQNWVDTNGVGIHEKIRVACVEDL